MASAGMKFAMAHNLHAGFMIQVQKLKSLSFEQSNLNLKDGTYEKLLFNFAKAKGRLTVNNFSDNSTREIEIGTYPR